MSTIWFAKSRTTEADLVLPTFAGLEQGWHYGEGGPIPVERLTAAQVFVGTLKMHGFHSIGAFPGPDTSVMLSATHFAHSVEIVFEADGTYSFVYEEKGDEVDRCEHVDRATFKNAFARAVRAIWPSFDSSIQSTTTLAGGVSRHTRTKIYTAACRSS